MRIVIGRGNRRKVFDVPCANIINRGKNEDVAVLTQNVCALIGVGENS